MIRKTIHAAAATLVLGLLTTPVLAQTVTHLDQPFQRHVTLFLRFDSTTQCASGRAFYERFPAGNIASTEFRVPGDDIFVITDFHWQAIPTPASFASNSTLEASLTTRFGSQSFRTAYISGAVNLTPEFASMNRIAGKDHMTAGVRVGSGRFLCASAASKTVSFTAFHTVASAEIHGYLLKK